MWDFGSAARHHQLYNPWLGDGRSRAGISTLRGAMSPESGRAENVARKIQVELEERGLLGEPVGVDAIEPRRAVRAPGRGDPGRRRPAADAGGARDQDAGRDHAAQHRVHDGRRRLRGALPGDAARACARTSASRSSTRCSTTWAPSTSRASTRSRGERCNPHPHVYTDRALRPGDPAYFDILHSFIGYRTCYYRTFAVGQRLARAGRRLQALPLLPRRGDRAHPPGRRRRPRSSRSGRAAEEFGFPDEEAAFALQFGHGVGLSIWEKPIFSRLVSLDHPEEIREGMVFALETFWPATRRLVGGADRGAARGHQGRLRDHHALPGRGPPVAGKPYYTVGGTLPLEREPQSNRNTQLDADSEEAIPIADAGAASLR